MTLINHVAELEPTRPALPLTHFTSPALGSVLSHTRTRTHRQRESERAAVFHSSREKLRTLPPPLCVSPDFSSHAGILTLLLLALLRVSWSRQRRMISTELRCLLPSTQSTEQSRRITTARRGAQGSRSSFISAQPEASKVCDLNCGAVVGRADQTDPSSPWRSYPVQVCWRITTGVWRMDASSAESRSRRAR